MLGKQTDTAEFLHAVTHRTGEGLDERAASRRARLVQGDIVDAVVGNFEALDVLTADVDDEVDVRLEVLGRLEVRHGLDQTEIHAECVENERLAVAGDRGGANADMVAAQSVQLPQLVAHDVDRIALVRAVIVVQHLLVGADQHELGRGRAAVDAEIRVALIHRDVFAHDVGGVVAAAEFLVLRLGAEQRIERRGRDLDAGGLLQGVHQLVIAVNRRRVLLRVACRTRRNRIRGEIREVRVLVAQTERLLKPLLQRLEEEQRTAEEQHIALDLASLCQTGQGLVDDRLENRRRDVLLARALVEQRLDVALGEYAAAGGDGIQTLGMLCQLIQLGRGDVEQNRHLVNKGTRAAGTRAIHSLFQLSGQEHDLGVLAAQLDDNVRLRDKPSDAFSRRKDLLHEVDAARLGDAKSGRTGDRDAEVSVPDDVLGIHQHLAGLFAYLGEMPLVLLVQDFRTAGRLVSADGNQLDSCRSDINS